MGDSAPPATGDEEPSLPEPPTLMVRGFQGGQTQLIDDHYGDDMVHLGHFDLCAMGEAVDGPEAGAMIEREAKRYREKLERRAARKGAASP